MIIGGAHMINIVDLFSGAGGLTFGFCYRKKGNRFVRNRKFNFLFANEYDSQAATAFRVNFPHIPLLECDVATITTELLIQSGIEYNNVDVVIGGPPCQSYSTVGKRQYDQRAKMYQEYIRLLGILTPKMFIFENVTGLLTMKNDNDQPVINDIIEMFRDINGDETLGYTIHRSVLNAKDYGVPQSRERVFLVGIRNDIDVDWEFPRATHGHGRHPQPYLTVADAISDLPELANGESTNEYVLEAQNDYQALMRYNSLELCDHVNGLYGEKMMAVIGAVIQGEGRSYINNLVEHGQLDEKYCLTSGYKNTYGRLWWDRPCTTITNSLGTPSALRCIHPIQDRALTTREGARLQSFPDWIHFYGNKYQKNSQVGNAVPPLLAMKLAHCVVRIPFEDLGDNI